MECFKLFSGYLICCIRCLHMCNVSVCMTALADAATQGGKMLPLCVVSKVLVCKRHVT